MVDTAMQATIAVVLAILALTTAGFALTAHRVATKKEEDR